MSDVEEGVRQGIKTLQCNNTNHSDSVGKIKKNLLDYYHSSNNGSIKMACKSTQVSSTWIIDDLTSDTPREHFWQVLAEKRRLALEEALGENEKLHKMYESLTSECNRYQDLLEEANSFVDVFKELVQDTNNDTGIDIGDVDTSTESNL